MMTLVTGIIGIAMMVGFLGFLVWWIRDLPFTIIVVVVVLLMLYDFVQTVRYGNGGGGR
ncbi:MAG: hypothetical protein HYY64_02865 [Candidatus Rokubacteria bacterium]|nr:hypothetical protein [Candidatus Rokubacteria bacterium]